MRILTAWLGALALGLFFVVPTGIGQEALSTKGTAPELAFVPNLIYRTVDKTDLCLDIAYPKKSGPLPTIVVLHGSGMTSQRREMYQARIKLLAEKGYVGAFVCYRNAPQVPFPGAVHDVQSAVRWLRRQAGKFPIDPARFAAVGYSAGGSLACLLAMIGPQDPLNGGDYLDLSCRVQACVSYFAPSDLPRLHARCLLCVKDKKSTLGEKLKTGLVKESLEQWLGGAPNEARKNYERASPINYVSKDSAPLLLLHGSADGVVPLDQSQQLEKQVKAAGGQARLLVFDKAPHDFDELNDDNCRRAAEAQWEFLEAALKRPRK